MGLIEAQCVCGVTLFSVLEKEIDDSAPILLPFVILAAAELDGEELLRLPDPLLPLAPPAAASLWLQLSRLGRRGKALQGLSPPDSV